MYRRGPNHAERLHVFGHLQQYELHVTERLHRRRNLHYRRQNLAEQLPKCASLLGRFLEPPKPMYKPWWVLGSWCLDLNALYLDGWRLDASYLYSLHVDAWNVDA